MTRVPVWNQYRHKYKLTSSSQTPHKANFSESPKSSKVVRQLVSKQKGKKLNWGRKKNLLVGRKTEKRGGLLSGGHFGCHLSPWRRGPGPQKPLGRTDCLRGARYFLQHHLSLSPHNDSPRSSLLMFVIALSHKGGMINGAERSTEGSGDVGLLFVHLMQPGSHYPQPLCVRAK